MVAEDQMVESFCGRQVYTDRNTEKRFGRTQILEQGKIGLFLSAFSNKRS